MQCDTQVQVKKKVIRPTSSSLLPWPQSEAFLLETVLGIPVSIHQHKNYH